MSWKFLTLPKNPKPSKTRKHTFYTNKSIWNSSLHFPIFLDRYNVRGLRSHSTRIPTGAHVLLESRLNCHWIDINTYFKPLRKPINHKQIFRREHCWRQVAIMTTESSRALATFQTPNFGCPVARGSEHRLSHAIGHKRMASWLIQLTPSTPPHPQPLEPWAMNHSNH